MLGMSAPNIAIIGCGNISPIYLKNSKVFGYNVAAVSDVFMEAAHKRSAEYGVPAHTVAEVLADPAIEAVLNLTIPAAHGDVALQVLRAGKHVYNEKPLAITREQAAEMLREADARKLRVGCAPDTFLGAGFQTCRQLIDEGKIGRPVAATAFMMSHGPEKWHPNPDFFYQPGAGPLFDMGPYYLTALISLLGPIARVSSSAQISFAEREIGSEPQRGKTIKVNTPTHVSATLDFENGAVATLVTTFDVWASKLPRIEIYGSEGSLNCPDPNTFGGPVLLKRHDDPDWCEMPLTAPNHENSRGIGFFDMLRGGHRANGAMANHVLDAMHAILESSAQGRHIKLTSSCVQPAALK